MVGEEASRTHASNKWPTIYLHPAFLAIHLYQLWFPLRLYALRSGVTCGCSWISPRHCTISSHQDAGHRGKREIFLHIVGILVEKLNGNLKWKKSWIRHSTLARIRQRNTATVKGFKVHLVLQWLPAKKGLVTGLVQMGFGAGAFVFNQIQTLYINPDNFTPDQSISDQSNEKWGHVYSKWKYKANLCLVIVCLAFNRMITSTNLQEYMYPTLDRTIGIIVEKSRDKAQAVHHSNCIETVLLRKGISPRHILVCQRRKALLTFICKDSSNRGISSEFKLTDHIYYNMCIQLKTVIKSNLD